MYEFNSWILVQEVSAAAVSEKLRIEFWVDDNSVRWQVVKQIT